MSSPFLPSPSRLGLVSRCPKTPYVPYRRRLLFYTAHWRHLSFQPIMYGLATYSLVAVVGHRGLCIIISRDQVKTNPLRRRIRRTPELNNFHVEHGECWAHGLHERTRHSLITRIEQTTAIYVWGHRYVDVDVVLVCRRTNRKKPIKIYTTWPLTFIILVEILKCRSVNINRS